VRSILQQRLHECSQAEADDDDGEQPQPQPQRQRQNNANISLLLGYRSQDSSLLSSSLQKPLASGVVDVLLTCPSNPDKIRVQDKVFNPTVREVLEQKAKQGNSLVFVCASKAAAEDFAMNLSTIVGCDVREALGERYIQEVYEPAV
jgi:hypothetical protein